MPALASRPETAVATATGKAIGSSTKSMLVRFEQNLGKTNLPTTTPYLVNEIMANSNLKRIQDTLADLKSDRDSIFKAKAELDVLTASIEKNTLMKPDIKNTLLLRATDLVSSIEQAMELNIQLGTLETNLAALETQRLKAKQEHYKAMESASHSGATAGALSPTDRTGQSKIEEYKKEAAQTAKLFKHLLYVIHNKYTTIREAAPGSLRMKDFRDFKPSSTAEAEQQPTTPTLGAR